jgi:hypothetical protein
MSFGLKFMKKNYINAAICYCQVKDRLVQCSPTNKKMLAKKEQYLLKLTNAVLCIVVRNMFDKKMFKFLLEIKSAQYLRGRTLRQQLTFFKPKKDKIY